MTQIFNNIREFWQREDKKVNGVSQDFANENPEWEKQNETNEGCWNCSGCSDCSDCSGCSRCSDCSGCSRCSGCSDCSRCSRLKNASPVESTEETPNAGFQVPIIENIHQKVLEAATSKDDALDMGTWHTCDTTHCRAGWVIHLAGKPGYDLASKTSTEFAAMQIYHKSNPAVPVSPVRFYESETQAIDDMKRCAEEEKNLLTQLS